MCQYNVIAKKAGDAGILVAEHIASIEVSPDGSLSIHTLFEAPKTFPAAFIRKVDCLAGKIEIVLGETM